MTIFAEPRTAEPTPESQRLAALQAEFHTAVKQLGQLNTAIDDPHGWQDHLVEERDALNARMAVLRADIAVAKAEMRRLTATVLEA